MKNSVFVSFCLVVVCVLVTLHAVIDRSLSPVENFAEKISAVERERQSAELRAQLAADQLADYQQHVATLLPTAIKSKSVEDGYALRQLASAGGDAGDQILIERASGLFEKGKALFRDKKYEGANRIFREVIERYPESTYVAEAHFLLAEGEFQLKDYESSVATIEKMLEIFPENELTGFALVRLAGIFEIQERLEDAADIYRAVLANFKQPELIQQANRGLKAVAL